MLINEIHFSGSFPNYQQTPNEGLPDFSFIGRSNVGKSSLINMLTNRKNLAHVSNTPGKTQLINYFKINNAWNLVDLPGYGYAKLSKTKRKEFRSMIENYLIKKDSLVCTFILIDSRHDLQDIDLEFINWCGMARIPIALVFTKMDKLRPNERKKNIDRIERSLLEHWEELPTRFLSSASTGEGKEEILSYIKSILDTLPIANQK